MLPCIYGKASDHLSNNFKEDTDNADEQAQRSEIFCIQFSERSGRDFFAKADIAEISHGAQQKDNGSNARAKAAHKRWEIEVKYTRFAEK